MKVYVYDTDTKIVFTKIMPQDVKFRTYDSQNVVDVSAIYSNAIEQNDFAYTIINIWEGRLLV